MEGGGDSNCLSHNDVKCLEVRTLTSPGVLGFAVGPHPRLAE